MVGKVLPCIIVCDLWHGFRRVGEVPPSSCSDVGLDPGAVDLNDLAARVLISFDVLNTASFLFVILPFGWNRGRFPLRLDNYGTSALWIAATSFYWSSRPSHSQ